MDWLAIAIAATEDMRVMALVHFPHAFFILYINIFQKNELSVVLS